jgi:hypothetical protein
MSKEHYMLTEKLLVVGVVMALAGGSALFAAGNKDRGSAEVTSMEHTPSEFEILHIKANADVKVYRADTPKIVIAAPSNLHKKIKLRTGSNKLEIRMAENFPRFSVDVYCPPLSEIGAADNSTLEFSDDVTQDDFTVRQLENGKITGSIDCETLRLDMVGSGTMLLTGSAKAVTIYMAGDGTVDAQNLSADKTNVNVVGKGEVLTYTTDSLSVLGVGFGTVHYRGDPSVHSLDMGPVRVIKLPDADTSDTPDNSGLPDTSGNSYSTKPVPKPIDSALTLTHTVLDSALELTRTIFDSAMELTSTILGKP